MSTLNILADGLIANVPALLTLVGPIVAFFFYKFKRTVAKEQVMIIGDHFRQIIQQVTTGSIDARVSAAIQMRRFLDSETEFGVSKTPYARDCLEVTSALLKVMPTSNLQKVLADNIRHVPPKLLKNADLQRANLSKAYLSDSERRVDLTGVDFFQANLSGATLKNTILHKGQFYEATLSGTSLRGCDLSEANFFAATLSNVDMRDADVKGTDFSNAKLLNIDFSEVKNLDSACFKGSSGYGNIFPKGFDSPVKRLLSSQRDIPKVFISRPGILDIRQLQIVEMIKATITSQGIKYVELERADYEAANVISKLNIDIEQCMGVIVFGFRALYIKEGEYRMGTDDHRLISCSFVSTPWNQIEAGIGIAQEKPTLLIHESDVNDGLFDSMVQDSLIQRIELGPDFKSLSVDSERWINALVK